MLLKGAALLACGHAAPADRPMADIDILAPHDRWGAAAAILIARGWTPRFDPSVVLDTGRHSLNFADAGGREIDLHRTMLWCATSPGQDLAAWRRSRGILVRGIPARAPSVADQLVVVMGHGLYLPEAGAHRWILDARALIAAGPDWAVVEREARQRDLAPFFARGASILASYGVEIPAAAREVFRAVPASPLARLENALAARRTPYILRLLLRHLRAGRSPLGFPAAYAAETGLRSPAEAARYAARRLRQIAFARGLWHHPPAGEAM
jgi:hypothetical protein